MRPGLACDLVTRMAPHPPGSILLIDDEPSLVRALARIELHRDVELRRPAEHYVERLVGNGVSVSENEFMQGHQRRFERATVFDAI